MTNVVEVRCPVGLHRLFTRLRLGEVRYIHPDNHIEFTCYDCARTHRETTGQRVQVFHRYTFAGELISTHHQPSPRLTRIGRPTP